MGSSRATLLGYGRESEKTNCKVTRPKEPSDSLSDPQQPVRIKPEGNYSAHLGTACSVHDTQKVGFGPEGTNELYDRRVFCSVNI